MNFGGLVGATKQLDERPFTLQVRIFARLAQAKAESADSPSAHNPGASASNRSLDAATTVV